VDDRHVDVRGHLLEAVLAVGAPDDRAHLAAEDPGDVGDRLPGADLREVAVDDHRVPPELGDAGREGELGAQRRLVEDDRHRPWPGQGLLRVAVRLERGREVEHLGLLRGGEVVVGEEVAGGHVVSWVASSRIAGRASTKVSSCSVVMVRGGARRRVCGATGLTMNPWRRAATTTAGAIS